MSMTVLVALLMVYLGDAEIVEEFYYGKAPINGTAKLQCNFRNKDNVSRESLGFYWQRGRESPTAVVYQMEGWELITDHTTKSYLSRTVLRDNCDLELYNLTLEDEGFYQCLVINRHPQSKVIHKASFKLQLIAYFSVPKISPEPPFIKLKKGDSVDFKCSSGGGFAKPTMYWKLSDGNRTWREDPYPKIVNRSGIFTISSNLVKTVLHNINVTCILEADHGELSRILTVLTEEIDASASPNFILIACVVVLIFITVLSIIWAIYKNRRKCMKESPQSNGSVETGQSNTGRNNTDRAEEKALMPPEQATKV